jgi:uncharacterized membrane protein YdjX (TVP38/TMEM64 family)
MATMIETGKPAPPASTPTIQTGAMLFKALVFLAIAIAGAIAYRFTPLKQWLEPAGQAAAWLRHTGVWGVLLLLLGMSALILMGVPRLLFCPLAGALMGFWGGLALSIAGTMLSYYAAFRVIRGRRANEDATPSFHPRLAFLAGHPGFTAVVVSRILPVPGMLVTLALSMSNVRTRTYLGGSMLGLIPEAAPLVLLGAGVLHPAAERFFKVAVAALVCILVAWLVTHYLVRRFKHGSRP